MNEATDSELLRRYADEKSEAAFAELVRRRIDLVYSVARRQVGGDAHLAEDVTQKVFADLARKAPALVGRTVLSGWLYRSAQFAASDLVRSERRRRIREQETSTMEETFSTTATAPDWDRLRPLLDEAMGDLNDDDRDAVALRFFEGRSFAEVGARLSLAEDSARKRVERAIDQLHARLTRRGVTSTSAALALALGTQAGLAAPAGLAASVTGTALAGAAAVGAVTGGGGLLIFMSSTKTIAGIAGVIALLAVGTAVYEAKLSRASEAELTATRTERDALNARLAATQKRARQSADDLTVVQKQLGDLRESAARPAAPEPTRTPASQYGSAVDYVLDHPETHAAYVQQSVLRSKARYDRFFKTAGLSGNEQEQFLKALQGRAASELDFMAALRTQGYGVGSLPKDPAVRAELMRPAAESAASVVASLRSLLGNDRYQQFEQYSATIPERNVTDLLAGQLYDSDAPLTPQQAGQLAQILTQNRFKPEAAPSAVSTLNSTFITPQVFSGRIGQAMQQSGMSLMDWPAPITDAAIARAQTVLTPTQLAALRQMQAQQVVQFQLAPPPPTAPAAANPNAGKK